ncbi:golgi uridine diphosphate-N- acetylglucosamine transporter [Tulasnella sp. 330]|nr:golgi uridine diphosphate-N- acetylglucosamine transporter [Tulasnella sp. 330]KAG8874256.1 golgi uridine diphosphate-N- acetylglucosamine transporter [Tulasnella sp. 331]
MRARHIASALAQSTAAQWLLIITLIFGGCGCNAWALEVVAARNPQAGTLITFAQYLLIVVYQLPNRLTATSSPSLLFRILSLRFKKLQIPLHVWVIQVILFWLSTLLNNAALGYNVDLPLHIIFRSAGLPANLLLGTVFGKKYTRGQVLSVILVTVGVTFATLSSTYRKDHRPSSATSTAATDDPASYVIGVSLLTLALLLSSAMGLAQENAYKKYGKGHWEEALFYLHFLGLPLFSFVKRDLFTQLANANASPKLQLSALSIFESITQSITISPSFSNHIARDDSWSNHVFHWLEEILEYIPTLSIPSFWIPLSINIVTQLICVSGVHRLTSRVSSLTVTLILAIRKAVSLAISVLLIQGRTGSAWLWGGGGLVLLGTITYSLDGTRQKELEFRETETKKEI